MTAPGRTAGSEIGQYAEGDYGADGTVDPLRKAGTGTRSDNADDRESASAATDAAPQDRARPRRVPTSQPITPTAAQMWVRTRRKGKQGRGTSPSVRARRDPVPCSCRSAWPTSSSLPVMTIAPAPVVHGRTALPCSAHCLSVSCPSSPAWFREQWEHVTAITSIFLAQECVVAP